MPCPPWPLAHISAPERMPRWAAPLSSSRPSSAPGRTRRRPSLQTSLRVPDVPSRRMKGACPATHRVAMGRRRPLPVWTATLIPWGGSDGTLPHGRHPSSLKPGSQQPTAGALPQRSWPAGRAAVPRVMAAGGQRPLPGGWQVLPTIHPAEAALGRCSLFPGAPHNNPSPEHPLPQRPF